MASVFYPAPVRGWNTRDAVSGLRPEFAMTLDNFVIENGVPRVRPGWRAWATGMPGRVDGLLPWNGSTQRLFASSGTGIYDVTLTGAVGAPVVTGLTNARWSSLTFNAASGTFLFAFNGVDTPRTYDGTTWATWTGTGVTGGVEWAGAHAGRLYVGNRSRLSFFYGGAGAIGGAFTEFRLDGLGLRGGGVEAMTTISGDGGSGPQTLTVFITTLGEALVFEGTDPNAPATWRFVGRWQLPRMLGGPHRCVAQYGGDALAVTEIGVVPLAALRSGEDVGVVLDRVGMTRRIEPTWRAIVAARRDLSGWGITPLMRFGAVVVNAPWTATTAQQIVSTEGDALTRWGGIPAAVWAEALGGRVFVGDAATGRVLLFGEDEADGGQGVRSEWITAHAQMGGPRAKKAHLVQAVLDDAAFALPTVDVLADWRRPRPVMDMQGPAAVAPPLPPLTAGGGVLIWDQGNWDQNVWAGASGVSRGWRSASAEGHAFAVRVQMVSGWSRPAALGASLTFDAGGPVR